MKLLSVVLHTYSMRSYPLFSPGPDWRQRANEVPSSFRTGRIHPFTSSLSLCRSTTQLSTPWHPSSRAIPARSTPLRSSSSVSPAPSSSRLERDVLTRPLHPATDDIHSIRSRATRKLAIPGDGSEIALQYLWCDVYYTLEDGKRPRLLSLPVLYSRPRCCRGRLGSIHAAPRCVSRSDARPHLTLHPHFEPLHRLALQLPPALFAQRQLFHLLFQLVRARGPGEREAHEHAFGQYEWELQGE